MPPLYGEDFVLNENSYKLKFGADTYFMCLLLFFCDKIFIIFSEYDIILMYFLLDFGVLTEKL